MLELETVLLALDAWDPLPPLDADEAPLLLALDVAEPLVPVDAVATVPRVPVLDPRLEPSIFEPLQPPTSTITITASHPGS